MSNGKIICGPPASGKMTVGQELRKLTGLKLFYDHMSLELVNQFFDFGTPNFESLDREIRFSIFKEIANSELKGLIFTIVWAFNEKEDEEYVNRIIEVFKDRKPNVCLVELNCKLEERLKRNRTENRLTHKPSKRDVDFSDRLLLNSDKKYRMNSIELERQTKKILQIENTSMSAKEAAEMIMSHYNITVKLER